MCFLTFFWYAPGDVIYTVFPLRPFKKRDVFFYVFLVRIRDVIYTVFPLRPFKKEMCFLRFLLSVFYVVFLLSVFT